MEDNKRTPISNTTNISTPPQPKKRNTGVIIAISCIVILILCCCIVAVIGIVAPSVLVRFVTPNSGPDQTLTRINEDEYNTLSGQSGLKDLEIQSKLDALVSGESYTASFTEKEIIAKLSSLQGTAGADLSQGIGIDIEPGIMKVELALGQLISSLPSSQQGESLPIGNLDQSTLSSIYIYLEINTNADGSSLSLGKISTGNPLFDSLLPQDAKSEFNDELNMMFSPDSESTGIKVSKIDFKKDLVEITYTKE